MKTFHILTVLTKPAIGYDPKWADYVTADSFEEATAAHDENLHRYGVIDFSVVTCTEVDPETLKPIGPAITYTP
jgi:hypothetical protein